jgi:rubredoxin
MATVRVYRCRVCQSVYDYSPHVHPKTLTDPEWHSYSKYHGKLVGKRVHGCPTCGLVGELPIGIHKD